MSNENTFTWIGDRTLIIKQKRSGSAMNSIVLQEGFEKVVIHNFKNLTIMHLEHKKLKSSRLAKRTI